MFSIFKTLAARPEPFADADATALWTTPHIAQQMLKLHLSDAHDVASRRPEKIASIIAGIDREVGLAGTSLLDLGCGPGLYARHFADQRADVLGLDFSPNSIAYARQTVSAARFEVGNYLTDELGRDQFDLVTLIYGDVCALAPSSRAQLFEKVFGALKSGGVFILDAFSRPEFGALNAGIEIEANLMDGFWAAEDYVGLKQTVLYPEEAISLDRYLIVEAKTHWVVCNWLKYFEPAELKAELGAAGFAQQGQALCEDWSREWDGDDGPFFLMVSKPR